MGVSFFDRLDLDSHEFLSKSDRTRAIATYRGLLRYAASRLSTIQYGQLLQRLEELSLPTPSDLGDLECGSWGPVQALQDLIWGVIQPVDSGSVWSLCSTVGALDVIEGADITGTMEVTGALTVAVGLTVTGAVTFRDDIQVSTLSTSDGAYVTALDGGLKVAGLADPPVGGGRFSARVNATKLRLTSVQERSELWPETGVLFEDARGVLEWIKATQTAVDRYAVVNMPHWDSGWFGIVAHRLNAPTGPPTQLSQFTVPTDFQLPAGEPGERGGIVDAMIWLRSMDALTPEGHFADPPYTFMGLNPGYPHYTQAFMLTDAPGVASGHTVGATIVADGETGGLRVLMPTLSMYSDKLAWLSVSMRVQLWFRGGN